MEREREKERERERDIDLGRAVGGAAVHGLGGQRVLLLLLLVIL